MSDATGGGDAVSAGGGYPRDASAPAAPCSPKPATSVNSKRSKILDAPLLVLKVGTSTLMVSDASGQRVQLGNVAQLVEVIAGLKRSGYNVVLVSSGAIGMGIIKLGLAQKPTSIRAKQAVAAAGQSQLMRMYEDLFSTVRMHVAQLLISQSDFLDKQHWQNVKHTIIECLKFGVLPIINENDSTSTEEIRFGDNDNLAALTAVQLEADGLFLFTDVDYLFTANPRVDPSAEALRIVKEPWCLQVDTREPGSGLGTGGMATKVVAARTVSCAGIPCGLINGSKPWRLLSFLSHVFDEDRPSDCEERPLPEGTLFLAMQVTQSITDVRRWILSLPVSGEVVVNDGAAKAIAERKSLMPAGIVSVTGSFLRHECVKLLHEGNDIARALVEFSSDELAKVVGRNSSDFEVILGYSTGPEACHRKNIILTTAASELQVEDSFSGLAPLAGNAKDTPTSIKRSHSFPSR